MLELFPRPTLDPFKCYPRDGSFQHPEHLEIKACGNCGERFQGYYTRKVCRQCANKRPADGGDREHG